MNSNNSDLWESVLKSDYGFSQRSVRVITYYYLFCCTIVILHASPKFLMDKNQALNDCVFINGTEVIWVTCGIHIELKLLEMINTDMGRIIQQCSPQGGNGHLTCFK